MSTSRPTQWFLGAIERSQCLYSSRTRQFHTTSCRLKRIAARTPSPTQVKTKTRRRRYAAPGQPNQTPTRYEKLLYGGQHPAAKESSLVKQIPQTRQAAEVKAQQIAKLIEQRAKDIHTYTPEQIQALSQIYTPQQIQAMLEAEQAIDPEDLVSQGHVRTDPAALPYLDDLASVDPILDKLRQGPEIRYGLSTPDSRERSAQSAAEKNLERAKLDADQPSKLTAAQQRLAEADEDPHLRRLMQQTGLAKEDIRKLRVKTLATRRVVNQTRIGKVMSQYSLVAAGNGNGLLGLGEGKASEFADANRQAMMEAIKKLRPVHRYESRTIYGDVRAKVGAAEVVLNARPPGFGVRTQHLIFEMARMAGITDLAGKCLRSHNPMNVCKATFQALIGQKLPEDVARARGLKMVDVRKVYYAGRTL